MLCWPKTQFSFPPIFYLFFFFLEASGTHRMLEIFKKVVHTRLETEIQIDLHCFYLSHIIANICVCSFQLLFFFFTFMTPNREPAR